MKNFDVNPHAEARRLAEEVLNAHLHEIEKMKFDIHAYEAFDARKNSQEISKTQKDLKSLLDGKEFAFLKPSTVDAISGLLPILGPLLAMLNESKSLKKLEEEKYKKNINEKRRVLEGIIIRLEGERNAHQKFDVLGQKAKLKAFELQTHNVQTKFDIAAISYSIVQEKIKEPLRLIEELDAKIQALQADIHLAQSIEQRLSAADSPKDRALLHQECEQKLGSGRPRDVIYRLEPQMAAAGRDREKLRARVTATLRKETVKIDRVFLDGNNLCYAQGNKFIGLAAVIAAANKISEKYPTFVLFDKGITGQVKKSIEQIRKMFAPSVEVHLIHSVDGADNSLLTMASENGDYVVSNDRFVEYFDAKVVKEKRVCKHNIIGNKIFINDLNIEESF